MKPTEKELTYICSKSYSTLNTLSEKTKNVWFVCHGMGYLSRYFLKYFKDLDPDENYIIAPQAPNKYYLNPKFTHVGASWLTRENTQAEIENILNYLDAIWQAEAVSNSKRIFILGYSQGVSIASRWVARRKINCDRLILLSGGIPKELIPEDFSFLNQTQITQCYGINDEYLNEERIAYERNRCEALFGDALEIIPFDGPHEVNVPLINSFA